ncbi:hypothetical protein ACHAXR_012707 [Thalassiosira sp. AJA248-18]
MSMAGRSQHQHQRASTTVSGDGATSIVLIDPVTDYKQVINAALALNHVVITIQMPDVELPAKFQSFLPTTQALKEAGVEHILSMHHRDVFSTTQQLQILARECNLKLVGIIPLSEVAVEVSDLVASCLGLPHNPLDLMSARREKGLMKHAVELAGLRVAKHARIGSVDDLRTAMRHLALIHYPIVVKTPSGMSTTDVCICSNEKEAADAVDSIVGGKGPDGRTVKMALLEEYIEGEEFAINIMAVKSGVSSRLIVTDMWKYQKTLSARYDYAEMCNPGDAEYTQLISYARRVAMAVGINHGAAHVELKASQDVEHGQYRDPVMIEIGARLSGGRKSPMAQAAINDWDPFTSLIQSHCGESFRTPIVPDDGGFLTPSRFVRHVFLPVERSGRVTQINLDTSSLTTLHSSAMIVNVGDIVKVTTDIVSFAGFVWLVGGREQVDKDHDAVLSLFSLVVDDCEANERE